MITIHLTDAEALLLNALIDMHVRELRKNSMHCSRGLMLADADRKLANILQSVNNRMCAKVAGGNKIARTGASIKTFKRR